MPWRIDSISLRYTNQAGDSVTDNVIVIIHLGQYESQIEDGNKTICHDIMQMF